MYIFDLGNNIDCNLNLGSTHGTFLNKKRVEPNTFQRIKNGDLLEFGKCPKLFFLKHSGEPEEESDDEEPVAEAKKGSELEAV